MKANFRIKPKTKAKISQINKIRSLPRKFIISLKKRTSILRKQTKCCCRLKLKTKTKSRKVDFRQLRMKSILAGILQNIALFLASFQKAPKLDPTSEEQL